METNSNKEEKIYSDCNSETEEEIYIFNQNEEEVFEEKYSYWGEWKRM